MNRAEEILSRIYDFMGLRKDSDFCKKFDIKPNTLSTWKKRNTIPYELIEKISQNENISLDFLFFGENKEEKAIKPTQNNYQIEVLNVKASAGFGIENELVEVVDTILLDKSLFKTPINQSKVKLVEVVGDSMYPTIKDGDYVIIDETKNYGIDGIYAINLHNQLLIKRLKFKLDGTVDIISDNHQYHSENYDPKETQVPLHILGIKILTIQR